MGFLDMIKGVLGGEGIQSALESTGLADHVGSVMSEGSAAVDAFGSDIGAGAEALGGMEGLPADLGSALPDIGAIADLPSNPA